MQVWTAFSGGEGGSLKVSCSGYFKLCDELFLGSCGNLWKNDIEHLQPLVGFRRWQKENALAIVGLDDNAKEPWWHGLSGLCHIQSSDAWQAMLEDGD
jgi:hypothetical protein